MIKTKLEKKCKFAFLTGSSIFISRPYLLRLVGRLRTITLLIQFKETLYKVYTEITLSK